MTEYNKFPDPILICLLRTDDHRAFQELAKRQFTSLRENRGHYVDESPEILSIIAFTIQKLWQNRHELDDQVELSKQLLGVIITRLIEVILESDRIEEHLFAVGEYLKRDINGLTNPTSYGTN